MENTSKTVICKSISEFWIPLQVPASYTRLLQWLSKESDLFANNTSTDPPCLLFTPHDTLTCKHITSKLLNFAKSLSLGKCCKTKRSKSIVWCLNFGHQLAKVLWLWMSPFINLLHPQWSICEWRWRIIFFRWYNDSSQTCWHSSTHRWWRQRCILQRIIKRGYCERHCRL